MTTPAPPPAPPPLVPLADLATWLGLPAAGDGDGTGGSGFGDAQPRAAAVLAAASALVRTQARRTWVDADTGALLDVPGDVQVIVKEAAKRAWLNPEGYTAESDGDYNYRLADESAGIYLTDEEQRLLGRYRAPRSGLWTLPTSRGEIPWRSGYGAGWFEGTWYAPVSGGEPIPWFSNS